MEISTLLASCALEKMNASMEHTIIQFLCLARTVKGVLVFSSPHPSLCCSTWLLIGFRTPETVRLLFDRTKNWRK